MTKLAHRLGVSEELIFTDVYSVTDGELLDMVPRPCYALLWLFPISDVGEETYRDEEKDQPVYDGSGPDEPVYWVQQTIGNVCGFMGLLYCVTNGQAAVHIKSDSELDKMVKQGTPAKPTERAAQLYHSETLEAIYKEAANLGDSTVPDAYDHVGYGFTAFVRGKDGHLWELEGRRKGPVNRGILGEDEDLLSERVLGLSIYPYINREKVTESRFSCTALVAAP
jgi:ubiquitin carboxyl-terminal hydrolase L3